MFLLRILFLSFLVQLGAGFGFYPAAQAQDVPPRPFDLELRLDSTSGPLLSSAITDGQLLVAQGWVPLLGGSGKAVLGNLIWQIYDASGLAVLGQTKIRQVLEMGGKEFVSFQVLTKGLANGVYYLALTHQNAAKPTLSFQASQSFEVKQPVAITRFLVDESSQGKEHRAVLYEDQSPHIFVYYHLAYDVPSVLIQIDVFDSQGKRLATRSAFKDRDPKRKVSRFGIRLNPGVILAGEKARVTALLSAPDGSSVGEEVFVEIVGVKLQVEMAPVIRAGEAASFKIKVPVTFSPPYTLHLNESPGLSYQYQVGPLGVLTGTVNLDAAVETGSRQLVLEVKDHAGRTASATVDILVEAGALPSLSEPVPAQQTGGGGGVGSSSPAF